MYILSSDFLLTKSPVSIMYALKFIQMLSKIFHVNNAQFMPVFLATLNYII